MTIAGGGTLRGGHVVLADLGLTPGHRSLVFGTTNGKLYVVKYDGTVANGFPRTLPREIVSTPAVGSIVLGNGSTVTAIVVGYGSNYPGQNDAGGIRAYSASGTLLWEAVSGPYVGATAPVVSAPAIGDVDGDGRNEVVWTSFDELVHVTDGAGHEKPGFPYQTWDTIWSSPALFDLDGDGKLEIIVGSDQHLEPAPIGTPNGGGLYVLRGDGSVYPGFPKFFDQVVSSSPAVGDIDGDGKPEIVVGTGSYWNPATHAVYAFHCDGSVVNGWPVSTEGQVVTAPALADLTGDGIPEVIVTDDNSSVDGLRRVYAFRGDGIQLFNPVVPRDYFGQNLSAGDPMVADVLGDTSPEILVPTNSEICVISSSGAQLTDGGPSSPNNVTFGGVTSTALSAIAVGTLDTSATSVDVIAVTGIWNSGLDPVDVGVWIWNPKPPTLPIPWGMFHQDVLHHGVVPGTRSCASAARLHTLTPCRLIDTRGVSAGAIGGPSLAANEVRNFVLAGRCGIPSSARSLVLNATVTQPGATGTIGIYPGSGTPIPPARVVSFGPGLTRASACVIPFSADGSGSVNVVNGSAASAHFILDVTGYFQ